MFNGELVTSLTVDRVRCLMADQKDLDAVDSTDRLKRPLRFATELKFSCLVQLPCGGRPNSADATRSALRPPLSKRFFHWRSAPSVTPSSGARTAARRPFITWVNATLRVWRVCFRSLPY